METSNVISIVAVLISVFGAVYMHVEGVIKIRERIARMETKVEVFWKDVSFDAAKILHTPHPENARRDYLLEQFMKQEITIDELKELVDTLKAIIDQKHREFGERTAASNLLRALERQYEI
jgi:hypothetical protein